MKSGNFEKTVLKVLIFSKFLIVSLNLHQIGGMGGLFCICESFSQFVKISHDQSDNCFNHLLLILNCF